MNTLDNVTYGSISNYDTYTTFVRFNELVNNKYFCIVGRKNETTWDAWLEYKGAGTEKKDFKTFEEAYQWAIDNHPSL